MPNVLPVVGRRNLLVLSELAAVGTADHPGAGLVLAKHALHGICNFTHGAPERGMEITQLFYLNRRKKGSRGRKKPNQRVRLECHL